MLVSTWSLIPLMVCWPGASCPFTVTVAEGQGRGRRQVALICLSALLQWTAAPQENCSKGLHLNLPLLQLGTTSLHRETTRWLGGLPSGFLGGLLLDAWLDSNVHFWKALLITCNNYVINMAALQTRENLPVVLRATYPENRVALTKYW